VVFHELSKPHVHLQIPVFEQLPFAAYGAAVAGLQRLGNTRPTTPGLSVAPPLLGLEYENAVIKNKCGHFRGEGVSFF